jgi:hypothetical protein
MAVGASFALASFASAVVIDFEDLSGQNLVPDGYGGVSDWGDWYYYDWDQPPYNPHSGIVRVYNLGDGHFTFENDQIFQGAWFAGYGSNEGFSPISFNLFLDGDLVHVSDSIDLVPDGNTYWLDSGYAGYVDMVQVNGSHGFYVMDDVTYVPAPGALALLGIGLLGARRRR